MRSRLAVSYVTDLEGQWERLAGAVDRDPHLALDGDRLVLDDETIFVFGGDAVDRGPSSRRMIRTFLEARERYGDRVVLLAGNRDLNKLRLVRELAGEPPANTPTEARGDRVATLRHILLRTMGAPDAFAFRAEELAREGADASDEAVVESFLEELAPDGAMSRYLAACRLAFRHHETLFVHGALGIESFGFVPGHASRIDDVDGFAAALDEFLRAGIAAFRERRGAHEERPPWAELVDYQAPVPGLHENPRSVVYGRLSDIDNNPRLPHPRVVDALVRDGVRRLVVGHSPSGDLPAFVRDARFELLVADSSRSRVPTAASVRIEGERVSTRGATRLDDEATLEVETRVRMGDGSIIGRREAASGRLIKATTDDGAVLTYRGLPKYTIEQRRFAPDELTELEPAP